MRTRSSSLWLTRAGLVAALAWAGAATPAASPPDATPADRSAGGGQARTLVTPNFRVTVEVRCAEGNVSCDDVRYVGVSLRTGRSLSLKGRTHLTLCADGVTPCRFLGYLFSSGRATYFVGENGQLTVSEGEKILVDERGEWR